eukprot:4067940-Amphidinium_carterae.1
MEEKENPTRVWQMEQRLADIVQQRSTMAVDGMFTLDSHELARHFKQRDGLCPPHFFTSACLVEFDKQLSNSGAHQDPHIQLSRMTSLKTAIAVGYMPVVSLILFLGYATVLFCKKSCLPSFVTKTSLVQWLQRRKVDQLATEARGEGGWGALIQEHEASQPLLLISNDSACQQH